METHENRVDRMLQVYAFIGILPEAVRIKIRKTCLLSAEGFQMWRQTLEAAKDTLVSRFDDMARNGGLETLKANDPEEFRKIWRAKFGKNPSV